MKRNSLRQRRFSHPTSKSLKIMLERHPVQVIGKKYGVSGNAIKKICKKYGLKTKPRGYWQKFRSRNGTGYEPDCA